MKKQSKETLTFFTAYVTVLLMARGHMLILFGEKHILAYREKVGWLGIMLIFGLSFILLSDKESRKPGIWLCLLGIIMAVLYTFFPASFILLVALTISWIVAAYGLTLIAVDW